MLRLPGRPARLLALQALAFLSSLAACSSVAEGPAAPSRAQDPVCPAGSAWDGNQCVRTLVVTEVVCPPGSTWDGGRCAGQLAADCPAGTALVPGQGCVADVDSGLPAAPTTPAPPPAPTATGDSGVVSWSSQKSPSPPPPGVLPAQPPKPRCGCPPNDLMCAMKCSNTCVEQPGKSCELQGPVTPGPPPPAGTRPFDRAAAVAALAAASQSAKGCATPGAAGVAKVRVLFSPTGAVSSATVQPGDFQGTPEGGCIAAAFRGARVPAFDGAPVAVMKTVAIP